MVPSSSAALSASLHAQSHPVTTAWGSPSPRIGSMFLDSFDSPRSQLPFALVGAPPIPPSLSLGAPASSHASPTLQPVSQPHPLLTPEPSKPLAMLQDHTNHPLSPATPPHGECTDSRQRRQLRIQHRRRMRRNAPISRASRLTPVADQAALNRRAQRVIRNREVALRARQKQKALMKSLENENFSLKSKATSLEVENSTLKTQIDLLRRGSFLDFDSALTASISGSTTN
ncbi:unnamed protein product [Agarophyton chilense]